MRQACACQSLLLIAVFALASVENAAAQSAGDYDQTFGTNGIARLPGAQANSMALGGSSAGNGGVFAFGGVYFSDVSRVNPVAKNGRIVKFTESGQIDLAFGNGIGSLPSPDGAGLAYAGDFQERGDGSVTLAGLYNSPCIGGPSSCILAYPPYAIVSRWMANGAFDSAYATGGSARPSGLQNAAAFLSDGAAVVLYPGLGSIYSPLPASPSFTYISAVGQVDGVRSQALTALIARCPNSVPASAPLAWSAMVRSSIGRMVMVAGARSSPLDLCVFQLDAAGNLDTTFGTGGFSLVKSDDPSILVNGLTVLAAPGGAVSLILQGDAKTSWVPLRADGTLPASGPTGLVLPVKLSTTTIVGSNLSGLASNFSFKPSYAIDTAGRLLVTGILTAAPQGVPVPADPVVVRITSDGKLDSSFGAGNGVASLRHPASLGDPAFITPAGIGVDGKGRVLVFGQRSSGVAADTTADFAVARLYSEPVPAAPVPVTSSSGGGGGGCGMIRDSRADPTLWLLVLVGLLGISSRGRGRPWLRMRAQHAIVKP